MRKQKVWFTHVKYIDAWNPEVFFLCEVRMQGCWLRKPSPQTSGGVRVHYRAQLYGDDRTIHPEDLMQGLPGRALAFLEAGQRSAQRQMTDWLPSRCKRPATFTVDILSLLYHSALWQCSQHRTTCIHDMIDTELWKQKKYVLWCHSSESLFNDYGRMAGGEEMLTSVHPIDEWTAKNDSVFCADLTPDQELRPAQIRSIIGVPVSIIQPPSERLGK